jgi:phage shock protein A
MALMERVSTLVRANLNDLIDRAEHPEKMIKQVILDMENQLLQVKTQVAIAIADEHLLRRKKTENAAQEQDYLRKAELAIEKGHEDLARVALERSLSYQQMTGNFDVQMTEQGVQVENLKSALRQLTQKLVEARAKSEVLIAEHRRARATGKAADAHVAMEGGAKSSSFDRMEEKVRHAGAVTMAKNDMLHSSGEARLETLERDDRVEKLLADLKARKRLT